MTDDDHHRRRFAYAKDRINGCECPAVAAGYQPSSGDDSLLVAETYDGIVRDRELGSANCIIDEDTAKEAWLAAIEDIRERFPDDNHESITAAEDVAEELGWL